MNYTITTDYSSKILTISPFHKDRNGGIAILVDTLSKYYDVFNCIPSTRTGSQFLKTVYFITSILKLLYYLSFKGIKIVHIHGASNGSFSRKKILIDIASFFDVKIIYHIHGGGFKDFYQKNKKNDILKTLKKTNALIVLSESWKAFFSEIIPDHPVFILNNMIEKPKQVNLPVLSKENKPLTFVFLGHILKEKGIYDLLDVIDTHKTILRKWGFTLIIAGSGNTEKLNKFIQEKDLNELVVFEGWVSGEKKQIVFQESDVYILPSYNEGLPISILEAMSYGKPIVSTSVGGIPDIVNSGYNGILFPPGDKNALWDALNFMINHPDEREGMGKKNLEIIKDFYPETVIPKLNEIYKYVFSNQSGE